MQPDAQAAGAVAALAVTTAWLTSPALDDSVPPPQSGPQPAEADSASTRLVAIADRGTDNCCLILTARPHDGNVVWPWDQWRSG